MSSKTVNVHEAKTHLSNLLSQVAMGQHFIIAKSGQPVARLIPLDEPKPLRRPGCLKGRIRVARDFDAPLPADLLDEFEQAR
jgi:prevent-host-death family protein